MQVSVEEIGTLERKFHILVPAQEITTLKNRKLKDLSHRVKVNGFRPGKVPLKVVEQRYGSDVFQEVIEETLNDSFKSALQKYDFYPIGSPEINFISVEPEKDFEYEASFEIYPELPDIPLETMSFEHYKINIQAEEIENALEQIRESNKKWQSVKRDAVVHDKVTISFEGKIDGQDFEGNKADDLVLELGKNQFLPAFEHGLLGMRTGETKVLDIKFPEDYADETLVNQTARFTVKMHSVEEGILPELNDEFAKEVGVEAGLETLKEAIQKELEAQNNSQAFVLFKRKFLNFLIETYSVAVPKSMLEQEATQLKSREENSQSELQDFYPQATKNIIKDFLIYKISQQHNIKADQESVKQQIMSLSYSSPNPYETFKKYMENENVVSYVESMVLEENVIQYVLTKVQLQEKLVTQAELKEIFYG